MSNSPAAKTDNSAVLKEYGLSPDQAFYLVSLLSGLQPIKDRTCTYYLEKIGLIRSKPCLTREQTDEFEAEIKTIAESAKQYLPHDWEEALSMLEKCRALQKRLSYKHWELTGAGMALAGHLMKTVYSFMKVPTKEP